MMRISILLLLVITLVSCRSGKLHKKGVDLGKETGETIEVAALAIDQVNYKQIRFKSAVELKSKAISQDFPITIHLDKDKEVWASISIGLEIARAKITPDSLFFMDKFNRKLYFGSWEELSELADFNLNFNILQSILIGDLLFEVEEQDQIKFENNITKLFQERYGIIFESKIDNSVKRVFEVLGNDAKTQSELNVSYKGFVGQEKQLIPAVINMILNSKTTSSLKIMHSKIDFQDEGLNFSFTVPSSYKRVKLSEI